ncbi:hypothetical protein BDY19DRAFT_901977 [Irpex rosettiformis]|uniref:Uncharacterized protein n=1 Tax=Irpex rosettiformis TaxID=378272 RepID=A0ACB8UL21_9APHY|nr:hypothetical protein BDY19DRAFT_901977 [Irpex rosettiformis]
MARFASVLLLVAAALPYAFATNCGSNEFFYAKQNCCLPHGGIPNPPSPPPSFQCPTNGWYYHPQQGNCVPSTPQTPTSPPPACHSSCSWKPDQSKCIPNNTPTPSPPKNTYTPPYPPKNTYTPPSPPKTTPTPPPTTTPSSPNCASDHFWYAPVGCCPHGGPPSPPSPPPESSCPTDGWYWHTGAGCCAPHHPVPPSSPPPTCKPGCSWNPDSSKCNPQPPTPPSNPHPQPSHHYKRHMKSRAITLCPLGLEACPIQGLMTSSGDYECLDTTAELTSCGGCASTGIGQDCTAIEGVWNVACNIGKCKIGSCASGYKLSIDGKSCLKL